MKITMLGCGSSTGIPFIGCDCALCTSPNPKNKRMRVSILIEINGKNLLVDTSPDLREQALRFGIKQIDAVLYTHDHADHTHGIDELRSFNYLTNETIPIYCDQATADSLAKRFDYALKPKPDYWYRPSLEVHILPEAEVGNQLVENTPITYFKQQHGKIQTLGFRVGNFAYSTDVNMLPGCSLEALKGLDVWIVDCQGYGKFFSHASLETTLGWVELIKPKQTIFTHMGHEFEYEKLASELPPGIVPGYDGLTITLAT